MNFRFVAFTAATVLIIASIYASSSPVPVFVEARKTVVNISCYPPDNGKVRCCGEEVNDELPTYEGQTYCTTCDDTNPPSHCTPREKIEREAISGTNVPKDLKNALTDAQSVTQEPTKNFNNKLNSSDFSSLETNNIPTKNFKDKLKSGDSSSLETEKTPSNSSNESP